MKAMRNPPEIVLRNGKPSAVIVDIEEYQELLERAEDVADLKTLQTMRRKSLHFKTLEAFLQEKPGHA
jgi:prevent-host-death family protein